MTKASCLTHVPLFGRQRGAVLVIGLVVLVVLTILSVAYSQGAVLQDRLAGNYRDLSVAFQSSEAGVRWSTAWLQSLSGSTLDRPFPCNTGCDNTWRVWEVGQYPADPNPKQSFWADARSYGTNPANDESLGDSVPEVYQQPRYIMEQQFFRRDDLAGDPNKGVVFYRIAGYGTGQRQNSDAVVRAVIAKRFE